MINLKSPPVEAILNGDLEIIPTFPSILSRRFLVISYFPGGLNEVEVDRYFIGWCWLVGVDWLVLIGWCWLVGLDWLVWIDVGEMK